MSTAVAPGTAGKLPRSAARTMVSHSMSGRIVRLSDPEMKPGVDAMVRELTSDPAKAKAWLQELGYLTPTGRVSRRYGGR